MEGNHWVEDWIAARCESSKSERGYREEIEEFAEFCEVRGKDFYRIVEEWRTAKRLGEADKDEFVDQWSDLVRAFTPIIRKKYAPLTVKNYLTVVKSFMGFWKVPVDVELPKRACVIYHNRDLKREEVRQILTFASPRDRVIWLLMVESGMRPDTAVNLKYWQIKDDFEAARVPMRILMPAATIKDRVGDRWTFIGEDGFRELKEYLKGRGPLKDDDYIFGSERKGRVKGEQFTEASLSVKFNRVAKKLGLVEGKSSKGPNPVRMYGLRKYFRNNLKSEEAYRKWWFGHSLGSDEHYISRDPETHRQKYQEGYPHLRIFDIEPLITRQDLEHIVETRVEERTRALQKELGELKKTLCQLQQREEERREELGIRAWKDLTQDQRKAVLALLEAAKKSKE